MSSRSNQQPHNLTKPAFSEKQAVELVEKRFGLKVSELKPLPSYVDQNFHVCVLQFEDGDHKEDFVLKITNSEESQNLRLIEVQTRIMLFLNKEGFPVPTPRFTKEGEIMFQESVDANSGTKEYIVRLLTYLPGRTVATVPMSPPVLYEIGQLAARLDQTLAEKFHHPLIKCLHRGEYIWNLANIPLLERYMYALGQSMYLEVIKQVIEQFKAKIVPKLSTFRPCINHGDFNDHNILLVTSPVSLQEPQYRVSGILDFSDMSYGYYVFEVAITIMYMMIESKDPLSVGGHVLAGFESIVPLSAEERNALFLLVCARFAQSLVMSAYTTLLHPENEEYLMITAKTGWKHLMKLLEMGQEAVVKIWLETAKTYT
ncbi:hydroxylysine kinase [Tiliqua scincoides]|uniref:hydroxylysine kinase n=1 Tax=Tiliqua scincoides TaxID=71010 RepID=UPI0034617C8A